MSDLWSDEELAAAVKAYREMQAHQAAGRKYSKAAYYQALAARYGRTAKAFEFRMQNISAVLETMGKPWLVGLNPAKHVGGRVGRRLVELLSDRSHTPPAGETNAQYRGKLPLMRDWLITVAQSQEPVTYEQMMQLFGLSAASLRGAIQDLDRESGRLGEPIISSLIVSESTGRCSGDFPGAFPLADEEKERQRVRMHWLVRPSVKPADSNGAQNESLEVRAIKFATVARRPDQAAFRKAVFQAHEGKCAITRCGVSAALDAAHRHGRSWKDGHNGASDGLLLRKDLHALYDRHLLLIDADGVIELTDEARRDYPELAGLKIGR